MVFCFLLINLFMLSLWETAAVPSCGSLYPLRALVRHSHLAGHGTKNFSLFPVHQALYAFCSGNGSNALLRCPAATSALGAGLVSC